MLPWVYEFHWTPFHITFLLVFFTVGVIVASTILLAFRRLRLADIGKKFESIQWHSDFHDLPAGMKTCRHEFIGDLKQRTCDNDFQCETCSVHRTFSPQEGDVVSPLTLQSNMFGFTMPLDRFYHRGHSWARKDPDGNYVVGLDDFGVRLVGAVDSVELPEIGKELHVNGIGWNVKTLGITLRILSPITGKVIAHGTSGDDWLLKIQPNDPINTTSNLLRGAEVRPWIMREMERLQIAFATNGVGATLADGGEIVKDFHKHCPNADWDGILGQMFLEA